YRGGLRLEYLTLEEIALEDKTLCLSYPLSDDGLTESIRDIGIIQPLIVCAPKPYKVVTGFKRLESARSLGLKELPCIIIAETEQKNAMLMAVHDNISRGFNTVEKAHCIHKMMQIGFSEEEIYNIMSILGLGRHDAVMKNLIGVACAEKNLKDFIVRYRLSMKNIYYLLWFKPDERDSIIGFLSSVSFTDSLLREILQLLCLIRMKKGGLPLDELDMAGDAIEARKILKRHVNPGITFLEEEFKRLKQMCSFPKNIDIKIDPFFEKEYIDITIKARDSATIEDALRRISNALKDGYVEGIFGITKNRDYRDRD
ncbi:MAG: ParB N-terminal domain-containing protein, partial [Syntrophorhabdaceae bacterium]|nr:ParB N-terminal domain-containing protein [Syntrophorhabdaceae bacterium]